MESIVDGILKGDRRSISRAISMIDNNERDSKLIMQEIFKKTGRAKSIGFTGAGGAGKSTLIGKLAAEFQDLGYTVAVIAVDPSSPVSGGAILGDRVRMLSSLGDKIYMRSMASRGAEGGVSKSLRNVIRILDAAGYQIILVESVGAGQSEVEISKIVSVTVVLYTPNTGDGIQAIKAGLSEIGDVYVVNKSDLAGASFLYGILLDLIADKKVLKCSARTGKGVRQLAEELNHLLLEQKYIQKERAMIETEMLDMILNIVKENSLQLLGNNKLYGSYIDKVLKKEIDPYNAALKICRLIFTPRQSKGKRKWSKR
jgi:LAO/AO transport system kinase